MVAHRWMRWWVVAKLLRHGQNVAMWDVDLTIHDDMYKYFKSEELGDMNWICGTEGTGGGMGCNGGACPGLQICLRFVPWSLSPQSADHHISCAALTTCNVSCSTADLIF